MCAVASLYLYYNMSYLNFQASLAKIFIYEIIFVAVYRQLEREKMTDCERTVDVSFTACHFLPLSHNIYKETVGAYYERKEQRPSVAFSIFINILFECLHLRRRLCDCDIDETEVCG